MGHGQDIQSHFDICAIGEMRAIYDHWATALQQFYQDLDQGPLVLMCNGFMLNFRERKRSLN